MKRLLAKLFGSRREDHHQADTTDTDVQPDDTLTHGVLLLVRDASSLGAYQLHRFDDETAAAEFVQYWFPPGFEHGALAFWTSGEQAIQLPGFSEKRAAEALILIHDPEDGDIVHPFSMPDMDLARAWLEEEEDRGLDLRFTSTHWTARATIRRDARGRPFFRAVELPAYQSDSGAPVHDEPAPSAEPVEVTPGSKTRIVRKGNADATPIGTEATEPAAASTNGQPRTVSDRLLEIAQRKRWDKRDEPFESFGSPPGRF